MTVCRRLKVTISDKVWHRGDDAFEDSHRFDMMRASLTVVRGSSKLIVSIGHGICSDGDARANALAPAAVDGLSFEVVLASLWVTINN
jgi:hypothetical protein